jgi:L,D-transpeptidase YcbB
MQKNQAVREEVMGRISILVFIVAVALSGMVGQASAAVPDALARLLAAARVSGDRTDRTLEMFYSQRGYRALWVDENGRNAAAQRVMSVLSHAASESLNPADYTIPAVRGLDPGSLANEERYISRAVLAYAEHRAIGRIRPSEAGARYQRTSVPPDPYWLLGALATTADPAAVLGSLGPNDGDFQRLRWAYNRMRAIVQAGGWPSVPHGTSLSVGAVDPRVAILRMALWQRGDYEATFPTNSPFYDEYLAAAVRSFKLRHGLSNDADVDAETVRALNVRAAERLRQLEVNLERRRWQPSRTAGRWIVVNIPAYQMAVRDDGVVTYSSPVVVGSREHMTPEISADMSHLVLNPYWYVPPSIANDEYLPQLRKDPLVLARRGFKAFAGWGGNAAQVPWESVDWQSMRSVPVVLRQEPGPANALGKIKFMLPNNDNIYLHDTPAKKLFSHQDRAYSHGCIRLADPIGLAVHLLTRNGGWDRERLIAAIESGKQSTVSLYTQIHVSLVYHTAWVDQDGTINFRKDVYGRDGEVVRLLAPRV